MVCFVVRGCLRAVLELCWGMFGDVWSSWLLLGFRMASPWPIFGNPGAHRASPWPMFGNRLSQGVAMVNFRKLVFTGRRHVKSSDFVRDLDIYIYIYIYIMLPCIRKLVLTGRRHGQFSEIGFHRATPDQIFGFWP